MELTIDQTLQQGVAAHNNGNLQEAERLYRAILDVQPKHPDANHNLGIIAVSMNQSDAALALFKTAVDGNSNIEQFWLSYIEALIKLRQFEDAKRALKKGKKKGVAKAKLKTLIEKLISVRAGYIPPAAPSQPELQALVDHYQNGRYEDAEHCAMLLSQQFPRHPFSWKILGGIYKALGRMTDALAAGKKATELDPRDSEAHNSLGVILEGLGRFEEAESSYKKSVFLKPDNYGAHCNLGNVMRKLIKFEEAATAYRQAIAVQPGYAEAHNNLGVTLKELGKLEESEASCRRAIAIASGYAEAYYNLGNTLQELGRIEDAEVNYRLAITLKTDYAEPHNNLGIMLEELGRFADAELSYRQAIALKSDFVDAYSNLGNVLKENGRFADAEASYRQAILLKPDWDNLHHNLGVLLFEGKRYDLAAEQFELSDIHKSKPYAIKCSYLQDEKAIFYEKFDLLVNQGEINATIGSLGFRSEFKYGIKKSNSFCNDPLKYVLTSDLNEQYDFEKIFVETARDVLTDSSVSYKSQGHLTNGVQTAGNIFAQSKVIKAKIEGIIHAEIAKYRIHFKDSGEGFIQSWPSSYEIRGWLVSMQSGGKLAPHMHDTGWITGSVYINVPPKSKTDNGNLVLCLSDQQHVLGVKKSHQSTIDVVTGSLCLFPSSLYHYTVPFEETEDRIVLAFDVVPNI